MQLKDKFLNVIFPPKCIICAGLLPYNSTLHLCSDCYGKLPFAADAWIPLTGRSKAGNREKVVSLFSYTGPVRKSLLRFKFHDKPGYYRTYGRLLAEKLRRMAGQLPAQSIGQRPALIPAQLPYDLVIGVPLHRRREAARGYNQAALLSAALSRELKVPDGSRLLKRHRYTEPQSTMDKQHRHQNVKEAFMVVSPDRIKGRSILLVDDILTTGSTLGECSRMLKEAGAAEVTAAVLATGRREKA